MDGDAERGIAAWDGKKVCRVDTRRGLAENQVLDVEVDQFDRVWARGPSSLTLISVNDPVALALVGARRITVYIGRPKFHRKSPTAAKSWPAPAHGDP